MSAVFGFNKNKPAVAQPPVPPAEIRDTLFGDMQLDRWPPMVTGKEVEPWTSFVRARRAIGEGHKEDAIAAWRAIADMPGLESRHYVQAWNFLHVVGVHPPVEKAKLLLGVVIEVPMNGGLDLLAAYPERTARYYNHKGGGVIWEHGSDLLDPQINALLQAAQTILNAIGPWGKPRPPAPPEGQLRINILSPAGLHFGQSTFEAFGKDPLARPAIDAGVTLMNALIDMDLKAGKK